MNTTPDSAATEARTPASSSGQVPLDSAQRGHGEFIWRFNTYHRVVHGVMVVSFFLLTLTGLPLRFSCALWSEPLIRLFGGVEMAGAIHRVAALMTFGYFGAHLGWLAWLIWKSSDRRSLFWGPNSMVPQPRDVVDFARQVKWYLGRGPRPEFPRFSYMEKFDYFAVFWGVFIIGGSGLLLWFPEFFSRWMPGWIFNVATVVHADEALLASGFIFSIHFFHVHFRPDKFPLDAVMFHGRATREYMEEEHALLARDLPETGEISYEPRADHLAPPPTPRQTITAAVLGFGALAVGILCIGGIVWAVSFC